MRKRTLIIGITLISFGLISSNCNNIRNTESKEQVKSRTIVTSDGEVDDMDSFIRLLLYSNEFNIEGLVYSSSQWHYAGDGQGTLFTSPTNRRYGERTDLRWAGTEWMEGFINEYASVYENLIKHDPDYPAPDDLLNLVKIGNIEFEGEMEKDTEGSDWIKSVLLDDEPGPVYLQIWGGTNTVARALKSIQDTYQGTDEWEEIYNKVSEKAIIYTVLDQDVTYTEYVAPNWPDIRVIYNSSQFWSFAYQWSRVVPDELKVYMDGTWFNENIKFNHGALLESYYCWGDGQKIEGDPEHNQGDPERAEQRGMQQYAFISEGDSPSYFFLLNFGLRSKEDPSYGGLGGRFALSEENNLRWEDGQQVTDFDPYTGEEETAYPQIRWVKVLQNDFAARADWCVNDYNNANHAPDVIVTKSLDISAGPGEEVSLIGEATDPDDNNLSFTWWQYKEAGTYDKDVEIEGSENSEVSLVVPEDAEPGQTIHIILEVSDDGVPQLTRFQRVIISVI